MWYGSMATARLVTRGTCALNLALTGSGCPGLNLHVQRQTGATGLESICPSSTIRRWMALNWTPLSPTFTASSMRSSTRVLQPPESCSVATDQEQPLPYLRAGHTGMTSPGSLAWEGGCCVPTTPPPRRVHPSCSAMARRMTTCRLSSTDSCSWLGRGLRPRVPAVQGSATARQLRRDGLAAPKFHHQSAAAHP